jgi:rhamnose transport system permease protein
MRAFLARWGWEATLLALVLSVSAWASRVSPYFLDANQIAYSLQQAIAVVGLLALGLLPVVLVGEIDISLPAIMALGNVLFAQLSALGVPLAEALPIVILTSTAAGALNGVLVVAFGLPSLAVTLGAMGAYRALALLVAGQGGYADFSDPYIWLGSASVGVIPASLVLVAFIAGALALTLHATVFGRGLYVVGNNAKAATMSGLRTGVLKTTAFAIAGAMSGVASLVYIGQFQSARADNASDILLFVVTAVVLGGADIFGGSGNVGGVALSLVLLGILKNGMGLANYPGPVQTLVIGSLLLLSVLIPRIPSLWRDIAGNRGSHGPDERAVPGHSAPGSPNLNDLWRKP